MSGRKKQLQQLLPGVRRILQRFQPYLLKQRALMLGSFLALVSATALRLLEPWPLKFVFDRLLAHRPGRGVTFAVLESLDNTTFLTCTAVALVLITGLRALADYATRVGFAKAGNQVLAEVRSALFRHLQELSMSFHTKARSGDLVVRLIGDVNLMRDVLVTAVLPLIASLLIMVGMWSIMFWLQWQLALLALATVPLLALRMVRTTRLIREAAQKQRMRQGEMAAAAAESMGAIKILKALSLEEVFSSVFSRSNKQSQKDDVKTVTLAAGMERTVDVLLAIATALVLWFGARLVLSDALSPGDLLVFLTYLRKAFNPIEDLAKYTGRLAKATAAGERVIEILDKSPDICDSPNAVPAPPLQCSVQFERVSFAYDSGRKVLQEIDFTVHPGQCVALVGESGIGKSTLLSLLLRLYEPTSGGIYIDRREIREYKLASLRAQMSVVLQDSILFAASVWDNIGYGAPEATREEIVAAAQLAHAHAFIEALPHGYDTVLAERGTTLSHGQRQRIAVARAAVRKAPLLILDEPTTGLDEENSRAVSEALQQLAAGRTTFLVSHDLQLVAHASLILYLENGRIIERGSHDELMLANGRYAALYRLQSDSRRKMMPASAAVSVSNGSNSS